MAASRARVGAYVVAALGTAALMPRGTEGARAFALSPAGLSVFAIALSLGGDTVEESGTLRRIRAGLALRLLAALLAFAAPASVVVGGVGAGAVGLGGVLVAVGLAGVGWFASRDARVLADLRSGQRISLRGVGARDLEIDAGSARIAVPLVSVGAISLGTTASRRGLLIEVEQDAKIQGPSAELPWVEERIRSRVLFLDEHQLGGDARDLAERIARAKTREPGGYR